MESFHISKGERELAAYVSSIYADRVVLNSRSAIPPYEVDVLLPNIGVAIEFNGSYYHSDSFIRAKSDGKLGAFEQHSRKRSLANAAGLRFAIVWESDWYGENRLAVESALVKLISGRSLDPILDKMTV